MLGTFYVLNKYFNEWMDGSINRLLYKPSLTLQIILLQELCAFSYHSPPVCVAAFISH